LGGLNVNQQIIDQFDYSWMAGTSPATTISKDIPFVVVLFRRSQNRTRLFKDRIAQERFQMAVLHQIDFAAKQIAEPQSQFGVIDQGQFPAPIELDE
jgi:hypothetical protein